MGRDPGSARSQHGRPRRTRAAGPRLTRTAALYCNDAHARTTAPPRAAGAAPGPTLAPGAGRLPPGQSRLAPRARLHRQAGLDGLLPVRARVPVPALRDPAQHRFLQERHRAHRQRRARQRGVDQPHLCLLARLAPQPVSGRRAGARRPGPQGTRSAERVGHPVVVDRAGGQPPFSQPGDHPSRPRCAACARRAPVGCRHRAASDGRRPGWRRLVVCPARSGGARRAGALDRRIARRAGTDPVAAAHGLAQPVEPPPLRRARDAAGGLVGADRPARRFPPSPFRGQSLGRDALERRAVRRRAQHQSGRLDTVSALPVRGGQRARLGALLAQSRPGQAGRFYRGPGPGRRACAPGPRAAAAGTGRGARAPVGQRNAGRQGARRPACVWCPWPRHHPHRLLLAHARWLDAGADHHQRSVCAGNGGGARKIPCQRALAGPGHAGPSGGPIADGTEPAPDAGRLRPARRAERLCRHLERQLSRHCQLPRARTPERRVAAPAGGAGGARAHGQGSGHGGSAGHSRRRQALRQHRCERTGRNGAHRFARSHAAVAGLAGRAVHAL